MNRRLYILEVVLAIVLVASCLAESDEVSDAVQRQHLISTLERHAKVLEVHRESILKAAQESAVDPRVLGAIIVVESRNRPAFRRFAEWQLARLSFAASTILHTDAADLSIGICQLKLSTALQTLTSSAEKGDLGSIGLSTGLYFIDSIAHSETNIRLAARHLSFLTTRRYPDGGDLMDETHIGRLTVIATEYHMNAQPLDAKPTDLYGELVAALAHSEALATLFEPAISAGLHPAP